MHPSHPETVDVVGLPAHGPGGLDSAARSALDAAEVVVGGSRHLELLGDPAGRELVPWPSPLLPALPGLLERYRDRRVVVLASGDPLVSGIGSTLVELLGAQSVRLHPAVSSAALARARMGWSAEESDVVTLVGRAHDRLRRHLSPRGRLVVLTHGDDAPDALSRILVEEGYGSSVLTVLGDLGSEQESRTAHVAREGVPAPAPRLHLVCVECRRDPGAERPPLAAVPGLPDDAYENDGQLTKRLVRAAALAHLAPQPGDVVWDLGAGAGSVGIEAARVHPRTKVHSVERDQVRAARIRRNADRLGVPDLVVHESASADAVEHLPSPDAVFVGGGATAALLEDVWRRLLPGGRLVVHAVTVETELVLHACRADHGGALTRLTVEDLEPVGRFHGWRPLRTVTQWSVTKPYPAADPAVPQEEA